MLDFSQPVSRVAVTIRMATMEIPRISTTLLGTMAASLGRTICMTLNAAKVRIAGRIMTMAKASSSFLRKDIRTTFPGSARHRQASDPLFKLIITGAQTTMHARTGTAANKNLCLFSID